MIRVKPKQKLQKHLFDLLTKKKRKSQVVEMEIEGMQQEKNNNKKKLINKLKCKF